MLQQIQLIAARIDSMQLRERALLLLAGSVLLFFLLDTFALQPTFRQQKDSRLAISDWEAQINVLRERSGLLADQPHDDPLQWHDSLQGDLQELESRLQARLGTLLEPEQAVEVLEQVLVRQRDMTLREVNATGKPMTDIEMVTADNTAAAGMGRYQLQLQLEGSYLGTLRYLQALEALPWKFFWESVEFEMTDYPVARVTLDIYTLGLLEG